MDNELIGDKLAERVAAYLERYWYLAHDHRDYCGVGFAWIKEEKVYYYCHFYDGDRRITTTSPPVPDDYLKKIGDSKGGHKILQKGDRLGEVEREKAIIIDPQQFFHYLSKYNYADFFSTTPRRTYLRFF